MSWYLLSAVSVLALSVSSLFAKLSMREDDSDPVASSIIFQFLLGAITFLFALSQGFILPESRLLPYFLFPGALYAIGTIAFFKAYKHIGASEVTVLTGAGVVVTVIASFLVLGDKLTFVQLIGILFILLAVMVVNFRRNQLKLNTGAWLALLGTSSYGLAVIGDTYIIRQYEAISYLALICFVPGILMFLWYIKKSRTIIKAFKNVDRNLLFFIALYAVQAVTFYLALQNGALVAQLSAIAKSSIILTVILATIFLQERKDLLRKLLAAIMTTAGVLLVT